MTAHERSVIIVGHDGKILFSSSHALVNDLGRGVYTVVDVSQAENRDFDSMLDWTYTYSGTGASELVGPPIGESSSVRWQNPTRAGRYGPSYAKCTICGNETPIGPGETIRHGDERLCAHMGGPIT